MKKILAILAVTAIGFGATAQKKGDILVYGNLGIGMEKDASKNKSNSFQINPGIGYQVNNNWTVGLGFDVMSSNTKTDAGTEIFKRSNFAFGPFARYTKNLSSTFSVFGQFDAMFGTAKNGIGAAETKTNNMNIGITPAVSVHVSKAMSMNFSFGGLNFTSSKVDAPGAEAQTGLNLNFGSTANVGVQFNF